jgi:hypothetical protein
MINLILFIYLFILLTFNFNFLFFFSNKYIVKCYGTMVFGNYIYITLEYAPKGDVLEYILDNGALGEVAAAKVNESIIYFSFLNCYFISLMLISFYF